MENCAQVRKEIPVPTTMKNGPTPGVDPDSIERVLKLDSYFLVPEAQKEISYICPYM